MPPLYLDGRTELFFRNLMAFEQIHYIGDSYIIVYITFLGEPIKTPNDVEILVQYGILKNVLGNTKEVSKFFNTICKNVKLLSFRYYYSDVCMKLDKFYNDRSNRNIAILKQNYFPHPWAAVAVIHAIVSLILSIVQTAIAVISSIKARGTNIHDGN
ncbi:hypothetical protein Nepgr_001477 [Nepenthes gracilis]|uniref:Uncharacterized protein n=1 Tax=Nepenthes gracilis TaxID=150966 RepID=A0AAD3P573_NEPGR|nr:hypothetical protein Nepgr_001477 [Nepenthes gracilis]